MTNLFSDAFGAATATLGFAPDDDGAVLNELESSLTPDDGPPALDMRTGGGTTGAGVPTCEMCGVEIPWAGKGRKPKRCQDHKQTRTRSESGGVSSRGATATPDKETAARVKNITADLQQGIGELAGTIAPVTPVTTAVLVMQGPSTIDAITRLAAPYPRVLDGLEIAAKSVPFMAVGKFLVAIVIALSVDFGRTQPYGWVGEVTGVAKAAHEVGWTPPNERQQQQAIYDPDVPLPPRFRL